MVDKINLVSPTKGLKQQALEYRKEHFDYGEYIIICEKARIYGLQQLQLSVEKDNFPSVKTILKNDGRYIRSFSFGDEIADIYIINL